MTYNEGLEAAARWHDCQAAALKSGRSHSLRKIKRFHEIAAQEIRLKTLQMEQRPNNMRVFVVSALDALDDALATIGGCGDGNCIVLKPKGQHTNGGCRCSQDRMKMQRFAFAMTQFRDVVARVCEASK